MVLAWVGCAADALDQRTTRFFRHVVPHAVEDAPVVESLDLLPVVILSHGNDRLSAETAVLAEDLASHGYAVVGIDHPYDARAAIVGGEAVAFAAEAWPPLPPPPAASFTEQYLLALHEGQDPSTAEGHLASTRAYVRAFFDRFLGGTPSTLLDEAPPPGVTVEHWPPHDTLDTCSPCP